MAHANNQHIEYESKPDIDIPESVDSERSPQLNKTVCRCRHGCQCACSRGDGQVEGDGGGQVGDGIAGSVVSSDAASDDGASLKGEEGLEDHKIEVGDMGMISLHAILLALAKHGRCTCHSGVLPEAEDYPFAACPSLSASGILSDSSMLAEVGDDRSMSVVSRALSARGIATRSASPGTFLGFAGDQFDETELPAPVPHHHFTTSPVFLAHERDFCFNMDIGAGYGLHYAPALSISDEATSTDHSAYDIW